MKYPYHFKSNFLWMLMVIISLMVTSSGPILAANGKITGRVVDRESREPLPAANIIITHSVVKDGVEVPLSRPLGGASDAEGYYFILDVPPGVYNISASMIGYGTVVQKLVKVDMDRTITLNFELASSSIQTDQVVVTAKREIIKQDVSATQEVITTARIEQMPVTRVDEFFGSVKGVELVSNSEGNGLSVRGGSIRETDVRLDGMSLQDPRSGNSYLALNSTTIQEAQVLTGGFEAKYGGIQSGLLNVVTKDGQRERYTASFKVDITPAGQRRYFGTDPYSNDSWIYKVYAGQYAMTGIRTKADSQAVPSDFWNFRGWNDEAQAKLAKIDSLTPDQRLELWKLQHPQYQYGNKPDYFIEGSITGPVPGASIPLFGSYAEKTTFMLGFKYENSQFAFPVGARDNYLDWNGQIKLTSTFEKIKLSVNAMYAKINTLSGGVGASYGGALSNQASSFGFLNSTESSVKSQAALIGSDKFSLMYNKSRLQFFDQRYFVGGTKLTHALSSKAFYTLEFQVGYTDQNLQPFSMDSTGGANMVTFSYAKDPKKSWRFFVPNYGSPNASTNPVSDPLGTFRMYGGAQRVDSSYTYTYQFKGDMTAQLGRHNQVEAGFSAKLEDFFMYSGTWFQSQLSFTPDTWQYIKSHPLQLGLYAQDKLEFEGMILNAGLRLDYLNPFKNGYQVGFPLSAEYMKLMNDIYDNLPGKAGSYERWSYFRDLVGNPPGWPQTENRVQVYISPRLGVSFPITEASKMYFNYGHFYQRQRTQFMYDTYVVLGGVSVPAPDLDMERTVSYEFGYEQMILNDFIFNVTAYYKDITNRPLSKQYISYDEDIKVSEYLPDAYKDIRGVELRLEKPLGRFVSFNAMYDYMVSSSGQSGLQKYYENRLMAKEEQRKANLYTPIPQPRANINLNIHTPSDFGPEFAGVNWLGSIYTNFFFEWRAGGRILLNAEEPDVKLQHWAEEVNYWNIDFRASKAFNTDFGSVEFVLTIKNLTNNKWLSVGNMTQTQYSEYKNSLKTPDKGGDDKWGQYKSDDGHIKTGWYEAPVFLNPRLITLGVRLNF